VSFILGEVESLVDLATETLEDKLYQDKYRSFDQMLLKMYLLGLTIAQQFVVKARFLLGVAEIVAS
jgi:hypothetical protein